MQQLHSQMNHVNVTENGPLMTLNNTSRDKTSAFMMQESKMEFVDYDSQSVQSFADFNSSFKDERLEDHQSRCSVDRTVGFIEETQKHSMRYMDLGDVKIDPQDVAKYESIKSLRKMEKGQLILINHTDKTKQFVTESQMDFLNEVLTFGSFKEESCYKKSIISETVKKRGYLIELSNNKSRRSRRMSKDVPFDHDASVDLNGDTNANKAWEQWLKHCKYLTQFQPYKY